jgi:hypothetical protein
MLFLYCEKIPGGEFGKMFLERRVEMGLVLVAVIAALVGYLAAVANVYFTIFAGTLKIDSSNPEKDVYRFDIEKFDRIEKRNFILLQIDRNADLSQK